MTEQTPIPAGRPTPANLPAGDSSKQRLLNVMREAALPSKDRAGTGLKHEVADDGTGHCPICGRTVRTYPPRPGFSDKPLQHSRGYAYGRARPRNRVPVTIIELANRINLDVHEATHLMWALQKEGKVTFRTGKGAGGTTKIDRIRLTAAGLNDKPKVPANIQAIENAVFKGNGIRMRAKATEAVITASTDIDFDEPTHWAGQAPTEVTERRSPEPQPAPEPTLQERLDSGDEALREQIVSMIDTIPLTFEQRWPLMADLMRRDDRRKHAQAGALALEEAGLIDLATQALTAIPDDTDLEQEVIDYLKETRE